MYVCMCVRLCVWVSICNGLIIVDPFFSERYSTLAATLRSLKHALTRPGRSCSFGGDKLKTLSGDRLHF